MKWVFLQLAYKSVLLKYEIANLFKWNKLIEYFKYFSILTSCHHTSWKILHQNKIPWKLVLFNLDTFFVFKKVLLMIEKLQPLWGASLTNSLFIKQLLQCAFSCSKMIHILFTKLSFEGPGSSCLNWLAIWKLTMMQFWLTCQLHICIQILSKSSGIINTKSIFHHEIVEHD